MINNNKIMSNNNNNKVVINKIVMKFQCKDFLILYLI